MNLNPAEKADWQRSRSWLISGLRSRSAFLRRIPAMIHSLPHFSWSCLFSQFSWVTFLIKVWVRILVQVTIYRRLPIGRDGPVCHTNLNPACLILYVVFRLMSSEKVNLVYITVNRKWLSKLGTLEKDTRNDVQRYYVSTLRSNISRTIIMWTLCNRGI